MAVDEALWQTAADRGRPLLRVYSWQTPSVSFGYAQRFPAHLAGTFTVIRRPTGGGVVYHSDDTTYSVIIPPAHRICRLTTTESYCLLHQAVAAALGPPHLQSCAGAATPRGQYECFANPVAGDVMDGARKLAGGAQRRSRRGLLHQGSIAMTISANRLMAGFHSVLNVDFEDYRWSAAEEELSIRLAREKYATDAWQLQNGLPVEDTRRFET